MFATKARQTLAPSEYDDTNNTAANFYSVKFKSAYCYKAIARGSITNGGAGTGDTFIDVKTAGTGSDPTINNFSIAFWMKVDFPINVNEKGYGFSNIFKIYGTSTSPDIHIRLQRTPHKDVGNVVLEAAVYTTGSAYSEINFFTTLDTENYLKEQSPRGDGWNHFILTKRSPGNQSYLYTYMNGYLTNKIASDDLLYIGITAATSHIFSIGYPNISSHFQQDLYLDEVILLKDYGLSDSDGMSVLLSSAQTTALADALTSDNSSFDFATGTTNLVVSNGFTAANSATFVNASAVGKLTNGASSQGIVTLPITTETDKLYTVYFDVTSVSGAQINVSLGSSAAYNSSNSITSSGAAVGLTLGKPYKADDTTSFLALRLSTSTSGHYVNIDNLRVVELPTVSRGTDIGDRAEGEVAEIFNSTKAYHVLNPTDLSSNITTNLFAWYRMGDTDAFAVNADGTEDSDGCQDSSGRSNDLGTFSFLNTSHFNIVDTPT